jgi:benzodiazapine receptor
MSVGRSLLGLVAWVAACFGAAAIGSLFTSSAIPGWYADLNRPSWAPPNWLFGPVWTALYLMMAVAAWLIWRPGGFAGASGALILFGLQLAFNAAWSPLFFGLRSPGAAFAEIVVLWCLILATLIAFWRRLPVAGVLLLPYLLWVSFASALNFAIWRLNR